MKTNIRKYLRPQRLLALVALILLIGLSMTSPLSAQEATSTYSEPAVLQGYDTDEPL